jgi:hypothetical protein
MTDNWINTSSLVQNIKSTSILTSAEFDEPFRNLKVVLLSDPCLFWSVYIWHKEAKIESVAGGFSCPIWITFCLSRSSELTASSKTSLKWECLFSDLSNCFFVRPCTQWRRVGERGLVVLPLGAAESKGRASEYFQWKIIDFLRSANCDYWANYDEIQEIFVNILFTVPLGGSSLIAFAGYQNSSYATACTGSGNHYQAVMLRDQSHSIQFTSNRLANYIT